MMKTKRDFCLRALAIVAFTLSMTVGLTWLGFWSVAIAEEPCPTDECGNNDEFTTDFRLQDCRGFKNRGENPYFILKPGYQLVLETPEGEEDRERAVITVLNDTKWIRLDGRWIRTRVVEERAFEWDEDEWMTIEISLNWFAICRKTNAVYYFGEWSRDCEDGFDDNDECTGEEENEGSWEAGMNGARPGLMMPGTFLLGAKYFQEQSPEDCAMDRGENVDMGLDIDGPAGEEWSECVEVIDTNPVEGDCGDDDAKIYCPGIGLVQDEDLELVFYGYVN